MSLFGAGALLSGLGSFASLFGGGNSGATQEDLWRNHYYWQQRTQQHLPLTMYGAKNAGIHPLAALGVGGQSVQPVAVTREPPLGPKIGKALKGMGAAASDLALVKANEKNIEARTDLIKKQTEALKQEIDQRYNPKKNILYPGGVIPGQPDSIDTSDWFSRHVDYTNPQIVKKVSPDITAGVSAADRWVNKRGLYSLLPTEEHAEAVGEMIVPQIADAITDIFDRAKMGFGAIFMPNKVKNEIIRLRKSLEKQIPLPSGMEYQFNPWFRGFIKAKKHGPGKLIKGLAGWDNQGNKVEKPRRKFPTTKQRWRNNPTWQRLRK